MSITHYANYDDTINITPEGNATSGAVLAADVVRMAERVTELEARLKFVEAKNDQLRKWPKQLPVDARFQAATAIMAGFATRNGNGCESGASAVRLADELIDALTQGATP